MLLVHKAIFNLYKACFITSRKHLFSYLYKSKHFVCQAYIKHMYTNLYMERIVNQALYRFCSWLSEETLILTKVLSENKKSRTWKTWENKQIHNIKHHTIKNAQMNKLFKWAAWSPLNKWVWWTMCTGRAYP